MGGVSNKPSELIIHPKVVNVDMGLVLRIDDKEREVDVKDDRISAPDKDEDTKFEIVHSDDVNVAMGRGVGLCIDDNERELDVKDDRISTPDKDEGTEYDIVQSDDFVLSCF